MERTIQSDRYHRSICIHLYWYVLRLVRFPNSVGTGPLMSLVLMENSSVESCRNERVSVQETTTPSHRSKSFQGIVTITYRRVSTHLLSFDSFPISVGIVVCNEFKPATKVSRKWNVHLNEMVSVEGVLLPKYDNLRSNSLQQKRTTHPLPPFPPQPVTHRDL